MPGVDHQAHQKRLNGVKGSGQQRDGHELHAAAIGKAAHQQHPWHAVALGLHQDAVGDAQHQIPGQHRDRLGKRGADGGKSGMLRLHTSTSG